jgi:DtxR family transcriptional regulator, Mn-dependent transcriptional regulator
MVTKLTKLGWIDNEPYHGFRLTKEGENISLGLIRKHRMLEVFLHQHLNYEWDEVHAEAERLEHVVSDMFIEKLDNYLGHPKFDPHGEPIPDKYGHFAGTNYILLNEAEAGKEYVIARVNDSSKEMLQYFAKSGLNLNSKLVLLERIEFDGSVIILLDGIKHLLSKAMSEQIYIAG